MLRLLTLAFLMSLLMGCASLGQLTPEQTVSAYYSYITSGRCEQACRLLTDSCRGSSVEACAEGIARAWKRAEVKEIQTLAKWLSSHGGSIEGLAYYDPRYKETPGTCWYVVTVNIEWQDDWIPTIAEGDNLFFMTLTQDGGEWRIAAISSSP